MSGSRRMGVLGLSRIRTHRQILRAARRRARRCAHRRRRRRRGAHAAGVARAGGRHRHPGRRRALSARLAAGIHRPSRVRGESLRSRGHGRRARLGVAGADAAGFRRNLARASLRARPATCAGGTASRWSAATPRAGRCPSRSRSWASCRSAWRWSAGAQAGDAVFVTGSPGDAAAGLALEQNRLHVADAMSAQILRDRFLFPTPRCEVGVALRGLASACIDVSDGLGGDLEKLCAASGCGAEDRCRGAAGVRGAVAAVGASWRANTRSRAATTTNYCSPCRSRDWAQ